jgi:Raf kinase inhibitor-like YbhB/YbcL family protein
MRRYPAEVATVKSSTRTALAVTGTMIVGVVSVGDLGGLQREDAVVMTIQSEAFEHEGKIPRHYTCEGDDVSPPLAWSGVPDGAQTLVLIVDDPDAPDPANPRVTWVHWVLYDIPGTATALAENVASSALPPGTREGLNDWKRTGYGGPCPPIGRHRYFHKLYALDSELGDLGRANKSDVERAMRDHVLAEAVLMGTYQKGD